VCSSDLSSRCCEERDYWYIFEGSFSHLQSLTIAITVSTPGIVVAANQSYWKHIQSIALVE